MLENLGGPMLIATVVVVVLIILMLGFMSFWRKVPQDKALVVTGLKKKVLSGQGGLVVPIFERADIISLENMSIGVGATGLTSQGVDIRVAGITIIKVKSDKESILTAMEQFNTANEKATIEKIKGTATEVLEGKLREIISKMTVEEIYRDREKFASSVSEVAVKDLASMGLELKSFTIKEIRDDNGYLDSLGKKQIAEVKKEAAIAQAEAEKETSIKVAAAKRESQMEIATMERDTEIKLAQTKKEKEEAVITAETEIAEANRTKQMKVLAIEEETSVRKAKTDMAYEIEANKVKQQLIDTDMAAKLKQEQKNVELTEAQMQVELTKKEQETKVAKQEAIRKQEELVAQVQKQADAEAYKVKTMAEANKYKRESDAEASKSEKIKDAESEAAEMRLKGEADASAIEARGTARAKAVELEGLAEAKVIREKAFAEAEAMQKKAQAYKEYGEAAMTEMIVNKLPQIAESVAKAIAEPMGRIDKITIIDNGGNGGNSTGASKVANYAGDLLTKVPEMVKATTGIDMIKILNTVSKNFDVGSKDQGDSADSKGDAKSDK